MERTSRFVLRRPAEQAEIIAHRGGQVALRLVVGNGCADVALAHLGAVRVEDERNVRVVGRPRAEGLDEREVLLRVGEVVLAADDVRDGHLDVVDDVDEVEDGRAVGALDDKVGLVGPVERDVAADEVGHDDGRLGRAELDRAVGRVGLAFGQQPVDIPLVDGAALALEVGALVALHSAAGLRALIPVEAEPLERMENDVNVLGLVARGVGVLDAQDEGAARVTGVEPVEERGAGAADMKHARGGGGKADADGIHPIG